MGGAGRGGISLEKVCRDSPDSACGRGVTDTDRRAFRGLPGGEGGGLKAALPGSWPTFPSG